MSELQQIANSFALLPPILIGIAIFLVFLPTIIAIFLRFFLYRHLQILKSRITRLLAGSRLPKQPRIIEHLEQRFEGINYDNSEQVNTIAVVEGLYNREYFKIIGIAFRCEQIDYVTKVLPNLLLSFGLLGTFLGITINLSNISQTIGRADVTNVGSLVGALEGPLQGMGIAFITSLIAVFCSAFLTVVNLSWNTSLAKTELLNSLEDYVDNIYLPELPAENPTQKAVDRLIGEFSSFLDKFGYTFEEYITKSIAEPVEKLVAESSNITKLAKKAYTGIVDSSSSIENSSKSLSEAAHIIEASRFAEKLTSATNDLSIAQNQFSQSSLVLKKSTQSIEQTLTDLQKSASNILKVSDHLSDLNQKYAELVTLSHNRDEMEKAGLTEIKAELAHLFEQLTDK